ncbi:hypothetical protein D3C76_253490 [compost metagenome]
MPDLVDVRRAVEPLRADAALRGKGVIGQASDAPAAGIHFFALAVVQRELHLLACMYDPAARLNGQGGSQRVDVAKHRKVPRCMAHALDKFMRGREQQTVEQHQVHFAEFVSQVFGNDKCRGIVAIGKQIGEFASRLCTIAGIGTYTNEHQHRAITVVCCSHERCPGRCLGPEDEMGWRQWLVALQIDAAQFEHAATRR